MKVGIIVKELNDKTLEKLRRRDIFRVWISDEREYEAFTYAAILYFRLKKNLGIFNINLNKRTLWNISSLSVALSDLCKDLIISFKQESLTEEIVKKLRETMKSIHQSHDVKIYAICEDKLRLKSVDGVITTNRYISTNKPKILISDSNINNVEDFEEIIFEEQQNKN